jgi:aryl-alcohol dehydrogenase-like predicted oxidoreductase
MTAYGVLAQGLLTGSFRPASTEPGTSAGSGSSSSSNNNNNSYRLQTRKNTSTILLYHKGNSRH